MKELDKIFKALGQETRLKIMFLLRDQELCVCELEALLGLSQSAISQHLRVLKEADLVTERRMGQWVLYMQNRNKLIHYLTHYLEAMKPGSGIPPEFTREAKKLQHLKQHPIIHHPGRLCCNPAQKD